MTRFFEHFIVPDNQCPLWDKYKCTNRSRPNQGSSRNIDVTSADRSGVNKAKSYFVFSQLFLINLYLYL